MNVLMLAPEFLPCRGGVGTYIAEIARNMPSDVNIHIVTPRRKPIGKKYTLNREITQQEFPHHIKIHFLGNAQDSFFFNLKFQLRCAIKIESLIREWDIDIIHSHSAMPDLFFSPKKVKIPIVTTIHTTIASQREAIKSAHQPFFHLDSSEQFTFLFSPGLIKIENWYYSNDRYFITVSEWAKRKIAVEKGIPPERIEVIHNGVDTHFFQPYEKIFARSHFPELQTIHSPVILFLSRLIQSKGIHDLITAIPAILKKNDATFVIAGLGKPINSPNRDSKVIYLGYIPHEMTRFLYSCADIFTLPSLSENFPLSILEAMASKNAVIASHVGGIPEMITHEKEGILIPPHDPRSLATAVTHLLEDDQFRKKLGDNARNAVIEKFPWSKAAALTRKYYYDVVDNAHSAC